ncbi:MAG: ornithine carbamoyltransferase [Candidatus Paceibacterota bacterium]
MKHFIDIASHSPRKLQKLLDDAIALRKEWRAGGNKPLLKDKVLGMVFDKPSLRTRVSFEVAMHDFGGYAIYLSPGEVQLGVRESVPDVARILSGYVDAIMARTFEHEHIVGLAKHGWVPVINGLSDYNHPCQAVGDALTIQEYKGTLKGLKVAYIGDGNNVATSLFHICTKLGAHFSIASPKGYELPKTVVQQAKKFAAISGSQILLTDDPHIAVKNADVIYTDTWTSMGQEEEVSVRAKKFSRYQVDKKLVSEAKKDVIVMHCLPAHRGEEITDEVMDGKHSVVFKQAENRLHAQKAILLHVLT